ncbi:MAG TPA: hypothetical protein EYP09_06840 [Anaerolineae bacterium]|nr:hypothetical protein [Anaerolineae bacterium]
MIRPLLCRLMLTLWCAALTYVILCFLTLFLRRTTPQLDFVLEMSEDYRWPLALLAGLALGSLLASWAGL